MFAMDISELSGAKRFSKENYFSSRDSKSQSSQPVAVISETNSEGSTSDENIY